MQHVAFSETVKLLMMKEQLVPIISILYQSANSPTANDKTITGFQRLHHFQRCWHPLHDFYRLDCLSECKIKDLKFYI